MNTTISGYPRIGKNRELKFAIEKYWKDAISETELEAVASDLRKDNAAVQIAAGISEIPCSDFSYYDGMLDTAFMLGCVPKRYRDLCLSSLDTYFAMARGYQGSNGDVKALSMRKWFNTNYHYLVPELDELMQIKLNSEMLFAKTEEAAAAAQKTGTAVRISFIGPFTFLHLAHYVGNCQRKDFVATVCKAYQTLIKECAAKGFTSIQIDEPSLVTDLTTDDCACFKALYKDILATRDSAKVSILLQTYFGDVRDCWTEICELGFDRVGLDLLEGSYNISLIKQETLKAELYAGVVNGKNIWRCQYDTATKIIDSVRGYVPSVTVSTSCPLLHVPYTVKSETKLAAEITNRLSFAEEKLAELVSVARLASISEDKRVADKEYVTNKVLFTKPSGSCDAEVQQKVTALSAKDFVRSGNRTERQKLQRKSLGLPLLPTTTIGSFPQTEEVKRNRSLFKKGEISRSEYEVNVKRFIKDCIALQESIGLDVLVHGEFERNDMVEFFGENLFGFVFTSKAWVQSYGTRCVKPPIIAGDVKRTAPITVEYAKYASSLTKKQVKGMLTGPVTILNWSFPREDVPLKTSALQIALAIREEVLDLEKAGVRIIQIDEAALREKLPLRRADWHSCYLDWAIDAFRLCHSDVQQETQIHTHMCYSEFEDIIKDIDHMDADVITFEASRSNLHILTSLKEVNFETEPGPGVYDIHSPRVPSVDEITTAVEKMLTYIPLEKLWVNPDCGLKTRRNEETEKSLRNLVEAAKRIRAKN